MKYLDEDKIRWFAKKRNAMTLMLCFQAGFKSNCRLRKQTRVRNDKI